MLNTSVIHMTHFLLEIGLEYASEIRPPSLCTSAMMQTDRY